MIRQKVETVTWLQLSVPLQDNCDQNEAILEHFVHSPVDINYLLATCD